ncbi:MAG: DUF3849 domain-containing protein [Ruminococcus sp.]|nr:DUF3849 domain-containing protein [Ruminococcus sp.]
MPDIENVSAQERTKEITDKLEKGIKELFEGEKFKEYLNTMSKFHNYSFNNTMLIAMQKPEATLVAGFNSWKNKFKRNVNKGEKGIQILAPAPYTIKKEQTKIDKDTQLPVLDNDGKPITEEVEIRIPAFKVVSVFDVSQTSGKELPTLGVDELKGDVKDYEKFFEALKAIAPVPVSFEDIKDGAKGYFDKERNVIAINEGMSETQTVKTAVHEIAHSILHNHKMTKADLDKPKDRNTEEVEAESIAYTVCQHFGIDTSDYSFAYVASWGSGKEVPELKASLETIRATANDIINKVEDILLGRQKEQIQDKAQETVKTESRPKNDEKLNIIGNTPFKDIPDKNYMKLSTDKALSVAKILEEKGIKFSGRINDDKTTLTISKADIPAYKEALAAIGKNRAAEKLPENEDRPSETDHFAVPVYLKTAQEARDSGEIGLFRQNGNENQSCRESIKKAINDNYHLYENGLGGTFDVDAALKQVMKEYPLDRISLLVASRIASSDWDKRFDEKVQKWANDVISPLPDKIKPSLIYYQTNEHSGLVNMLAGKIMEKQLELENSVNEAVAEDVQRELDKSSRFNSVDERLLKGDPEKEAMLMNSSNDTVAIYQLKRTPENRDISFAGLDYLEKMGKEINRDNYNLVYCYNEDLSKVENMPAFLESVFGKFNNDHPKDYEGHSLSVSDVIAVKKGGQITAHFVDTTGFKELSHFGQIGRDNPLKAIEDTVEQNDNSFDGIINNTPQKPEIKEKPERKAEAKRSIRSYLRDAMSAKQPENKTVNKEKGMER